MANTEVRFSRRGSQHLLRCCCSKSQLDIIKTRCQTGTTGSYRNPNSYFCNQSSVFHPRVAILFSTREVNCGEVVSLVIPIQSWRNSTRPSPMTRGCGMLISEGARRTSRLWKRRSWSARRKWSKFCRGWIR